MRGLAGSAGPSFIHLVHQRCGSTAAPVPEVRPLAYSCAMATVTALPLFHLYGDPPDDQAFDFIHIETISSRSSVHDWTIRAHRHRNLFQILLIERGGGQMTHEAAIVPFTAPAVILIPASV